MRPAEKLSITLPADMARMVRDKVEGGAYASNSEVIREALRAWQERESNCSPLCVGLTRALGIERIAGG